MPKYRLESKSDPSAATANTNLEPSRTLRTSVIGSRYMRYFNYFSLRRYHLRMAVAAMNDHSTTSAKRIF